MFFSLLVLSMSLSIDSLFLGLAYGASKTKISFPAKIVICLCSVAYAAIALLIGHWFSLFVPEGICKIAGAALLGIIGTMMIARSFGYHHTDVPEPVIEPPKAVKRRKTFEIVVSSIKVTIHITQNPKKADRDNSGDIDWKEALLIGSALSIDSLSVGIGSALIGLSSWYLAFLIGICQLIFLNMGLYLTKFTGFLFKNEKRSMQATGVFLIVLGIIRCF